MPVGDTLDARDELTKRMVRVWWLLTREDFAADGSRRVDPILGADPLGILTYTLDRFAAQFTKRDRSETPQPVAAPSGVNNTGAVSGYDAYFGSYSVDRETGDVTHRLEGALNPDDVGMEVARTLTVKEDRLQIRLATTSWEGEAVTRILTWERIG